MKTFNLSEISTTKRTEILNEARENGAILQKKNTNGEVLEEFVLISMNDHNNTKCDMNDMLLRLRG